MGLKNSYETAKVNLLSDIHVCLENRSLWETFFEWQERKLKRINNLPKLDDANHKTLSKYIGMFRNVSKWFRNKPWADLTKQDIQRVYDDLEDGIIKNRFGEPFADRKSYYTKVFKAKPFKLAGKTEIAEEVFEFFRPTEKSEVNFIEFCDFKKLTAATRTVHQRLLLWLAWDVGENIMSLLQLRKRDFRRQSNPETNEPEYLLDLRKEILKRSRVARVEIILFDETVELLDVVLELLSDDDLLFPFGQRQAAKFMTQCVKATKVNCSPTGKDPTFKDLRSSMCCYLLKEGWRIEEINSRLGHRENNLSMVTRYANYLALNKRAAKKRLSDNNVMANKEALGESKNRERMYCMRIDEQEKQLQLLENEKDQTNELIRQLIRQVAELQDRAEISVPVRS